MKRVHVESGIYLIINKSGKVSDKCFEIVKARTVPEFKDAITLFKSLHKSWSCVYMYKAKFGFRVEFKTYRNSLFDARALKEEVEAVMGEWEDGK